MIVREGINLEDGTRLEPGDAFPGKPAKWLLDQGLVADAPAPTDSALQLAREQGIDIEDVEGTGADDRVTKKDVEAHIAGSDGEEEE